VNGLVAGQTSHPMLCNSSAIARPTARAKIGGHQRTESLGWSMQRAT
jgi:hypothetical protein